MTLNELHLTANPSYWKIEVDDVVYFVPHLVIINVVCDVYGVMVFLIFPLHLVNAMMPTFREQRMKMM